ncbi:MAG: carboxypeptidase regulatory-like domain-containing protein, partial [Bacteroidia bacterium]
MNDKEKVIAGTSEKIVYLNSKVIADPMMPFNRLLYAMYILLVSFPSLAQNRGSVRGRVLESRTPVEFANVFISSAGDSAKTLKVTTSDSTGKFLLDGISAGNYLLKIQLMGYVPYRTTLQLDSLNASKDLQEIQLLHDGQLLDGVSIISHEDLIRKTTQGFIINAKDNISQIGGTATDLLRSVPTVVVDAEGGITIRGKNPLILINGRNSSLSATDRIPASSIESIEIINNPSAQYDADAEGGIINIRLKKNTARGTNGSVGLGTGYGASGRVNSSFIISHQEKKWNFGLAYDNRFAKRTRNISANRTSFYLPQDYYLSQIRFDNRFERTQNLKLNIDFSPDTKNQLSFEAIGNLDGQDNDETLASTFTTQTDSFTSKNSRRSIETGREKVAEFALNYARKYDDPRRSLTANASSSLNFETENTDITTQSFSPDNSNFGDPFLQRTFNYQNSSVSNLRIDYIH